MTTRVLVLDNYDSFTWNLVDGLETAGGRCVVRRSDAVTLAEIEALRPDRIVLSPGPFGPERAGICGEVVRRMKVPMLGVCLGMQVMAVHAGARVVASGKPVHGKAMPVAHDGSGIFKGVPSPFAAARYHSLIVEPGTLGWPITATGEDGTVLAFRSPDAMLEGVLFHPESFLTEHRQKLFANFLAQ